VFVDRVCEVWFVGPGVGYFFRSRGFPRGERPGGAVCPRGGLFPGPRGPCGRPKLGRGLWQREFETIAGVVVRGAGNCGEPLCGPIVWPTCLAPDVLAAG